VEGITKNTFEESVHYLVKVCRKIITGSLSIQQLFLYSIVIYHRSFVVDYFQIIDTTISTITLSYLIGSLSLINSIKVKKVA